MNIFLTGATGFLGRSLVQRLFRDGHRITAWVRDPEAARSRLGPDAALVTRDDGPDALSRALAECDAIVNLAGDPLFGGRWTAAKKQAMVTSRVDLTRSLVAALRPLPRRPRALVSASAIGFYGDRGDEVLDERAGPAPGYLADLCRDWEDAALEAEDLGIRVACFRVGIVLGTEGGALAAMLPAFRLGLGGPLGGGKQWMSWIHLDDMVELLMGALGDPSYRGILNATAPHPVRQRDFARALGSALGRPAFLPAPGPAVRLLLGEAAGVLLGSQRVLPMRAQESGFRFRFPSLEAALEDILGRQREVEIVPAENPPAGAYLQARPATHRLRCEVLVERPGPEVFRFFSEPRNLGLLTPGFLRWRILRLPPGDLQPGSEIEYRIWLGPIPLTWTTRIEAWEPDRLFVDSQQRGPYRAWWHSHRFEPMGDRTRVVDEVHYSVPFGPLGRLVHWLFVAPSLRRIFGYRSEALARLLPTVAEAGAGPHPAPVDLPGQGTSTGVLAT